MVRMIFSLQSHRLKHLRAFRHKRFEDIRSIMERVGSGMLPTKELLICSFIACIGIAGDCDMLPIEVQLIVRQRFERSDDVPWYRSADPG